MNSVLSAVLCSVLPQMSFDINPTIVALSNTIAKQENCSVYTETTCHPGIDINKNTNGTEVEIKFMKYIKTKDSSYFYSKIGQLPAHILCINGNTSFHIRDNPTGWILLEQNFHHNSTNAAFEQFSSIAYINLYCLSNTPIHELFTASKYSVILIRLSRNKSFLSCRLNDENRYNSFVSFTATVTFSDDSHFAFLESYGALYKGKNHFYDLRVAVDAHFQGNRFTYISSDDVRRFFPKCYSVSDIENCNEWLDFRYSTKTIPIHDFEDVIFSPEHYGIVSEVFSNSIQESPRFESTYFIAIPVLILIALYFLGRKS